MASMTSGLHDNLTADLAEYKEGFTLPRRFYFDPEYFDIEMSEIFQDWWFQVRHISEFPEPGSYSIVQIGQAQIIIVRGKDDKLRAFHNVCRHRGNPLCYEKEGKVSQFLCPYHHWNFSLDGKLKAAPFMADDFVKSDHALLECHVVAANGFVFVNPTLDENPKDFDSFFAPFEGTMEFFKTDKLRLVERRQYPIEANWKAAIENLLECYHCLPAHPQFVAVESRDSILAIGAGSEAQASKASYEKFKPKLKAFEARAKELGMPLGEFRDHTPEFGLRTNNRALLGSGRKTGTESGEFIADKLIGGLTESDFGSSRFCFGTMSFGYIYADHVVILSYMPRSVGETMVETSWFVADNASDLTESQKEELTWLWHHTTEQDGALAENQVPGISNPNYIPGPLSKMEAGNSSFCKWYADRMKSIAATS